MSDDVLTYIPALRIYARSLCKRGPDADDLVQDTLVRAIEKISSYTPGTNMRAWLFRIMRNLFYNNCAKWARERPGDEGCISDLPIVPQHQDWHMSGCELRAALADLPSYYREAIVLVIVLGESYQRAAEVLDCDIGTIKSRISRGRNLLRRALGEEAA